MDYDGTSILCNDQYCAKTKLLSSEIRGLFYESIIHIWHISDGTAYITFDISQFRVYSITVENMSQCSIETYPALSPNGVTFKDSSHFETVKIEPKQIEIFQGTTFVHYSRIYITATKGSDTNVYFQGQLLSIDPNV